MDNPTKISTFEITKDSALRENQRRESLKSSTMAANAGLDLIM